MRVNRAQMLFPLGKCPEVGECLATLIHLPCFVSALSWPTCQKRASGEATRKNKHDWVLHLDCGLRGKSVLGLKGAWVILWKHLKDVSQTSWTLKGNLATALGILDDTFSFFFFPQSERTSMPIVIMFYLSIFPFIQPRTEVINGKIINNCITFIKLV